jgi:pimeloyl-ACP methyl ester carboxylesterase
VSRLGLLFLHALPFDGSMWAGQMGLLPRASSAPTLYGLGETVEEWAGAALQMVDGDRLIVVGCSVGGSCAIEVACAAPDRIAALVLIGTKSAHRPDPNLHAAVLETLRTRGMEGAWEEYWAPLFSKSADERAFAEAKRIALVQSSKLAARGVTAFHTRPSRPEFLPTFPRPVVVVTGAEDNAPGLKVSVAQADAAPLGSLNVIAGSGHYVPLEKPAELNAILSDLIVKQG